MRKLSGFQEIWSLIKKWFNLNRFFFCPLPIKINRANDRGIPDMNALPPDI
jgi:hypothetical protein